MLTKPANVRSTKCLNVRLQVLLHVCAHILHQRLCSPAGTWVDWVERRSCRTSAVLDHRSAETAMSTVQPIPTERTNGEAELYKTNKTTALKRGCYSRWQGYPAALTHHDGHEGENELPCGHQTAKMQRGPPRSRQTQSLDKPYHITH